MLAKRPAPSPLRLSHEQAPRCSILRDIVSALRTSFCTFRVCTYETRCVQARGERERMSEKVRSVFCSLVACYSAKLSALSRTLYASSGLLNWCLPDVTVCP